MFMSVNYRLTQSSFLKKNRFKWKVMSKHSVFTFIFFN